MKLASERHFKLLAYEYETVSDAKCITGLEPVAMRCIYPLWPHNVHFNESMQMIWRSTLEQCHLSDFDRY